MQAPEVRYARSGSIDVAYQVLGEGPLDLLYIRCGSTLRFEEHGEAELKGVPGRWELYAVAPS